MVTKSHCKLKSFSVSRPEKANGLKKQQNKKTVYNFFDNLEIEKMMTNAQYSAMKISEIMPIWGETPLNFKEHFIGGSKRFGSADSPARTSFKVRSSNF